MPPSDNTFGPRSPLSINTDGGEMGERIRTFDWSQTPLGSRESWSPALRQTVRLMMANRLPMLLWWGPQYLSLYNDSYIPVLGNKHPWALGQPVSECWREIWHVLKPLIDTPFYGGPASWDEDITLVINRHGFAEETHWLIAYSAVPDDTLTTGIGGVLATVHETTQKVLSDRRMAILRDLANRPTEAETAVDACTQAARTLDAHTQDIPFALFYLLDEDQKQACLVASMGVEAGATMRPDLVDLSAMVPHELPFAQVLRSGQPVVVDDLSSGFSDIPTGTWSDAPIRAVVIPIRSAKPQETAGFFVVGVSSRLRLDDAYQNFLDLATAQIATAVANGRSAEEERQRNEVIAQAKERLRESEERFRTLFESMDEGFCVIEFFDGPHGPLSDYVHVLANSAYTANAGIPDIVGQKVRELVPDEADAWVEIYRNVLLTGKPIRFERELIATKRNLELAAFRIEPPENRQVAVLFKDVSDRKRAEQELQRERDRLRVTLESIGDAVVTTDISGMVTNLNAVAESLTGWKVAEAAGKPLQLVFNIINEQTRATVDSPAERALREGTVVGLANHTLLIAKDGTERPIEDSAAPIRGVHGEIIGCVLVFRDASERRRAEEALRASEERFQFVRRSTGVGFWYCDLPFDVLQWDEHVKDHFHLPADAVVTINTFYDRLHPDDRESTRSAIERSINNRMPYDVDYRTVDPSTGAIRWVRAIGRTFYDQSGLPIRFDGVTLDVTDRKRADDALRESELRYRLVGEAANDTIWDWDLITNRVEWNEGINRLFGYAPEQIGDDATWWLENVHPEDRDRITDNIHHAIDHGVEFWNSEYRFRREDGSYAAVFDRGRVVRREGTPIRMVGSMLDLTERRKAEAALRERTAQLALTLAATGVGMWLNPLPLGELNWDARTRELFFVTPPEEPTAELFWDRLHPDDREPTWNAIQVALRDGSLYEIDHRVVNPKTGEIRWMRSAGQATLSEDGVAIRFDGINYDITDRKRMEEELRQIAAELSEADRRKDEFLAILAHELRNPLAPIRNALQVIKLTDKPGPREDARTLMERQLEQMVRLVDDLLDVSRITRGKVELRKEHVELAVVLNSAMETSRPLIEQMNHELLVSLPEGPVIVDADPTRLAQVFSNLLTNAAKYSDRGSCIKLTAKRQESDVVVSVSDTGIGIPSDKLNTVFDMFSQVDRSLEKAQGGLGIGLTLVKRLTEMHGGSVQVHSQGFGKGSEFVVRLPCIEGSTPVSFKPKELLVPGTPLRILIVDDNRDGADSLSMMLGIMGHRIFTAYDGLAGVETAQRERPDVILLDIGLPILNGYEACRRIRGQAWGKSIIMVAVTGWGQEEDRRRSREAGFDHHMVKPVDPSALTELLSGLRTHQ